MAIDRTDEGLLAAQLNTARKSREAAESVRDLIRQIGRIHPEFATPMLYAHLQGVLVETLSAVEKMLDDIADARELMANGDGNSRRGSQNRTSADSR